MENRGQFGKIVLDPRLST